MAKRKFTKITKRAMGTAAALAAAVALAGCIFSPPPGTVEQPPPEMTTPANVLKNIEVAYNQRDINYYKNALSTNFVFYFDPNDVGSKVPGSTYIIPDSWSYTDDWQATNNMFQKAYSIDLTIPTGSVGEPPPGAKIYTAENISINLKVMIDETNGYITNKGYCNFEFEKYTNNEGKVRWRLTKWWDHTFV